MTAYSKVYVSKKLEGLLPSDLIKKEIVVTENLLGKWNATVFFVSKKKCILMTNSLSRYSVILPGLAKNDFHELTDIVISNLLKQFQKDEITVNEALLKKIIGIVSLFETDNDRTIIGVQNYINGYVENWKYEFGEFSNWDFIDIGRRINGIPYKQIGWFTPKEKMKQIITELTV